jgi:Ni/Co efflux regulator RcnB
MSTSRFGWPQAARVEEFRKCSAQKGLPTYPLKFQGRTQDMPMITVPIGLPKYRLVNGRTVSSQQEYLAKKPEFPLDFFDRDPELLDVQEVQHTLLQELVKQAGLLDFFKIPGNEQDQPLLLDEYGFVVNGNRRLTAWRDLYAEDPEAYGHFSHIRVVVLPHSDEKEIDRLEAALQIKQDIKADYVWHTEANMMKHKIDHQGFTIQELSDIYGQTVKEIERFLEMRDYAAEYLKSRGKTNHWSEIKDEFAFEAIVKGRSSIKSVGEKQLFKEAAFVLVDNPSDVGGRLYQAIPDIQEYLGQIKNNLQNHFKVEPATDNNEGLGDLFGGGPAAEPTIDVPLANVIAQDVNKEAARQIIIQVIANQKELRKEAKNASFLLDQLSRANATLTTAIGQGLRADAIREGVAAQLDSMEAHIKRIRNWLSENA